jgi:uncharacterized membrane protein
MTILILGLIIFLGMHSIRMVADERRTALRTRFGAARWKAGYALISLIGLVLVVHGYGLARQAPIVLWVPPIPMRHIAALLTAIAFVLLAAAYVPHNRIKSSLHHPMLLGVKVWALAHLLANGNLADLILFGSFLAWAIVCFSASRRRDRAAGTSYPSGTMGGTLATLAVGLVAWAVFALWLHERWIGVRPFG